MIPHFPFSGENQHTFRIPDNNQAYGYKGVGQVLFYRARLEGAIAAVISLRTGRARAKPGLGAGEALSRVVLRYALAPGGEVRVHRGWLYTRLPAGTRLRVLGYQADGPDLLVSLRPIPPVRGGNGRQEQVADQFRLPFRVHSWGTAGVRGVTADLRLGCDPRPDGMLFRGRLTLVIQAVPCPVRLQIPFCRLLAATLTEGLSWRALGGVVRLACRVEPDGTLAGEAVLSVTALGGAVPVPEEELRPSAAAVREISGAVERVMAEHAGEGRALVRGVISLDIAWAGEDGCSRWTGRELPFSSLVTIAGLLEGDRLEAVAQLDRVTRVGQGAGSVVAALVAVGVTALRTVHLPLGSHWYRMEQVTGQAAGSALVEAPLFAQPALPETMWTSAAAEAALPESPDDGWERLEVELTGMRDSPGGWRCDLVLRTAPVAGGAPEGLARAALGGQLPAGGGAPLVGIRAIGGGGVRVQGKASGTAPGPAPKEAPGPAPNASAFSRTGIMLPAPFRLLSGVWLSGGRGWEARLLVHQTNGASLVAEDLNLPAPTDGADWRPVAATAYGVAHQGERPQSVQIDVNWQRLR